MAHDVMLHPLLHSVAFRPHIFEAALPDSIKKEQQKVSPPKYNLGFSIGRKGKWQKKTFLQHKGSHTGEKCLQLQPHH